MVRLESRRCRPPFASPSVRRGRRRCPRRDRLIPARRTWGQVSVDDACIIVSVVASRSRSLASGATRPRRRRRSRRSSSSTAERPAVGVNVSSPRAALASFPVEVAAGAGRVSVQAGPSFLTTCGRQIRRCGSGRTNWSRLRSTRASALSRARWCSWERVLRGPCPRPCQPCGGALIDGSLLERCMS